MRQGCADALELGVRSPSSLPGACSDSIPILCIGTFRELPDMVRRWNFRRMQTDGNELEVWDRLAERRGTAVTEWAKLHIWLGWSSIIYLFNLFHCLWVIPSLLYALA